MGLHPRAIDVLILMTWELIARGYRVCLSTHSSQVIEVLWALRNLQLNGASGQALLGVFKAPARRHAEARRDSAEEERQGLLLRFDYGRNQRYLRAGR